MSITEKKFLANLCQSKISILILDFCNYSSIWIQILEFRFPQTPNEFPDLPTIFTVSDKELN